MEIDAKIEVLIVQCLTDSLSQEEEGLLQAWLLEDSYNQEYMDSMARVWKLGQGGQLMGAINPEQDWKQVRLKMGFGGKKERSFIHLFTRIAAVLIPALVIISALFAYYTVPGFGRLTALNTDDAISEYTLPDNTLVTLNTNSRITFNKQLKGEVREIELQGEAFFEVAKNPERPFIIHLDNAVVEVIGTAFNLEKRSGLVSVHVAEGRVSFSGAQQNVILSKGEMAIFDGQRIIRKEIVNDNYFSWKSGVIKFNQAGFEEILNALVDHYDEVLGIDEYSFNNDILVTTSFVNQPIQEVIDELQIHFNKKIALQEGFLHISD